MNTMNTKSFQELREITMSTGNRIREIKREYAAKGLYGSEFMWEEINQIRTEDKAAWDEMKRRCA